VKLDLDVGLAWGEPMEGKLMISHERRNEISVARGAKVAMTLFPSF